jgi:hypothetical protein
MSPFEPEENAEAIRALRALLSEAGLLSRTWHDGSPIDAAAAEAWTRVEGGSAIVNSDIWPEFQAGGVRRTLKAGGEELEAIGAVAYRAAAGGLARIPAFPIDSLAEGEAGGLKASAAYDEMGLLRGADGDIIADKPMPALYPVQLLGSDGQLRLSGFFSITKESAWAPIPEEVREGTLMRLLEESSERAREIWGEPAKSRG